MLVDSHMHPFPNIAGASGFDSVEAHFQGLQRQSYFNVNPTRRVGDYSIVERQTLWNGRDDGPAGLVDAGLRSTGYGLLEWSFEGESVSVQAFAPSLQENTSTPEYIIAEMNYAEVDVAVCQQGPTYGRLNEFLADAVRRFPDRLIGLGQVEEADAHTDEQMAVLERCAGELNHRGLFYSFLGFWGRGGGGPADPKYAAFWARVESLGLVVYWDLNVDMTPTIDAYADQLFQVRQILERHPSLRSVLVQALPPGLCVSDRKLALPARVDDIASWPEFNLEIAYPISYGGLYEYPYQELFDTFQAVYDVVGPNRLVWGSDMPNVLRFCTYRQSYGYLGHIPFLSDADRDAILGGNLARVFGLIAPADGGTR